MGFRFLHITLFILIAFVTISGQAKPGSLLYDMGLMIEDSNKVSPESTTGNRDAAVLTQEQEALEEELNSYQQKLAETEIRLLYQTQVIDSLQTEIVQIKSAGETDRALLSTRITSLVGQKEKASSAPKFVPGTTQASDSVFAELDTPWRDVTVTTRSVRQGYSGPRLTTSEEQAAYRSGLTKFHQEFYYQAIEDFNNIVLRGVDVTMRANAQYWVGRCYYEKGLYDDAISALEQVQRFEHSDKLDDALVMIGLAFKNKDRLPEAKLAFQELVTRHPGSEYLTLAKRFVQD